MPATPTGEICQARLIATLAASGAGGCAQPGHADRQHGERGEDDADQRRLRRADVEHAHQGGADAHADDVADVEDRHDAAAYGIADRIVQPALRDDEHGADGEAVESARGDPEHRMCVGRDACVGKHDERREDHVGAGMADAAHDDAGEQAAGNAACGKPGQYAARPGRREAIGAEPHGDVGEHQPVADRHQRHRDDDRGDGDERPRLASRAGLKRDRLGFGVHDRRLPIRRALRSGKSDISGASGPEGAAGSGAGGFHLHRQRRWLRINAGNAR